MPIALLKSRFGFSSFRPYQEAVCEAATRGRDVLLVMPTGAGKSLCYQLPGLARGGTTLVVSPLIALMEDQVAKLVELGMRAERIHSGRGRDASRAACRAYLDGGLDFLFIAPERLRVPGFSGRCSPVADLRSSRSTRPIASRSGDTTFGQSIGCARGALAPATPRTLHRTYGNGHPPRSGRHCRAAASGERGALHSRLSPHQYRRRGRGEEPGRPRRGRRGASADGAARRPAIVVYAPPTRRESESLAELLSSDRYRAVSYHAGMTTYERTAAQEQFLGELSTSSWRRRPLAWGSTRPHVLAPWCTRALPATLEGYYQEIGRAGRDGGTEPSGLVSTRSGGHEDPRVFPRPVTTWPERVSTDALREARRPTHAQGGVALRERSGSAGLREVRSRSSTLHGGARVDADESIRRGSLGLRPVL